MTGLKGAQINGLSRSDRRAEILAAKKRAENAEAASGGGDLAADVATNTADIATNTADIATNTADIITVSATVAGNVIDIAGNTSDIADNAAAIAALPASANVGGGQTTETTSAAGSLTFTHGLDFTPTAMVITPRSPNSVSTTSRFVGVGGVNPGATTCFVGRCTSQDGSVLASTSVTFNWIAFG